MWNAAFSAQHRNRTTILLVACAALGAAALAVGIDDNPPGIALMYLSATAFVLAFALPLASASGYRRLALASALAFVVGAVLHNAFDALAGMVGTGSLLGPPLEVAAVAFFFLAVLLSPVGLIVGVVGAIVRWRRERT